MSTDDEELHILDQWQAEDGQFVVRINGIGTEFRAATNEAALELAGDELERLMGTAEGRATMREHGLFERYAWVRERFAIKNAHVGATALSVAPITEAEYDALAVGAEPFVIDFWAAWCQPCKQYAPIYEQVAHEFAEQGAAITFRAADLDTEATLGQRLEVLAVPTTIGFREGREVFRLIGGLPHRELADVVRTKLLDPT